MGNDGGSIPGRRDLVKEKAKEIKVDSEIIAKGRATLDTITKQKLRKPIVACRLGFFYNKESLLRSLIEKSLPKKFEHIVSLKDIVDVNIEDNKKSDATFPFVCPVSSTEFNGLNRFILLWPCGCVFSEKAFNETKNIDKNKCLVCGTPFKPSDIVSMNMTPQEQEKVQKEIIHKREEKKAKKKKEKESKSIKDEEKEELKEEPTKKQHLELHTNILERLDDPEIKKVKELENKSETYKGLFHKEQPLEENLVYRNVRHGIR